MHHVVCCRWADWAVEMRRLRDTAMTPVKKCHARRIALVVEASYLVRRCNGCGD